MKNKFKKGLILGGILSALAAIGFAMTKNGRQLSEDLQDDMKILAQHVKENLHYTEDITKENFNKLICTIVGEYSKTKELTSEAKETLINELQSKWDETEKEYAIEKESE